MNISEVVGRKVMLLFHSAKGLESIGIDDQTKYCRIAVSYTHLTLPTIYSV